MIVRCSANIEAKEWRWRTWRGLSNAEYAREVHLEYRFLNIAGHPLVSLADLSYELLTLPVARHLQTLDLACRSHQVTGVVAVALPSPGRGELSVVGFQVLGHLLLEDLFEDGLHTLADPGFHVQLYVVLELVFWGQVSPSSLNPQLTRHYLSYPRNTALYHERSLRRPAVVRG